MRLVCPISSADSDLFTARMPLLMHYGGLGETGIVVIAAPSVSEEMEKIAHPLQFLARDYVFHTMDIEPEGGWPNACNQHFARAVVLLANLRNNEPFFWFEPDVWPNCPDWMQKTLTDYNLNKRPFWGHVRDTSQVMKGADGRHLVGAGIYPPNFHEMTTMWRHTPANQPFDVWMRWVTGPNAHSSKLYAHLRRTCDYRENAAGELVCKSADEVEGVTPNRFVVPKEAVLIHGCRDASLAEHLLQGIEVKMPEQAALEAGAMSEPDLAATVSKENMAMVFAPIYAKIRTAIVGVPTMTTKQLGVKLNIPQATIEQALKQDGHEFEVIGPPKWVKVKKSESVAA